MSQTTQQQQGAVRAESRPRKDWELFWRIIAGLMLVVVGWIVWVLYQITPRSVVTPLVYESQVKRSGAKQPEAGATAAFAQPGPTRAPAPEVAGATAAPPPTPEATAGAVRMEEAQTAMRAGAHQASADVQAATLEQRPEPVRAEKLKLATEIATPLAEKQSAPQQQKARPEGAPPVAAAAAGKARP